MALKRILLLAAGSGIGGGEKNLYDIAVFLRHEGIAVSVILPKEGKLRADLEAHGCTATVIPFSTRPSLRAVLAIRAHLRHNDYDLVHCHGSLPAFYGRIANRFAKQIPFVYTIHGAHYLHYDKNIKKALFLNAERLLRNWTTWFICVCQADLEHCAQAGTIIPEKAGVIYYGIEEIEPDKYVEAGQGVRCEFGLAPDTALGLHLARFHYQKGQEYLLEALSQVVKATEKGVFLLVGDGPRFDEMKKLAEALALPEDRVIFTGARTDSYALLAACDFMVLSSRWEGLPFTILEAMNMGRAVVSTDVDGIPEAIEVEANGLLVPEADPDTLAKALISMLEDPERVSRMGAKGREIFQERFVIARMCDEIFSLYEDVLSEA